MASNTGLILFVILIAFVFDFINGFHDAANAVATIVGTGVLTPHQAVIWAAFFNFIAFIAFNLMVAKTIGYGLVDHSLINPYFILSTLGGAIIWNLVTWYYGLPSSSSHALIGGLAGTALVEGGLSSLKLAGFIKVGIGILVAPAAGLLLGLLFSLLFKQMLKRYDEIKLNSLFKGFQLLSSALLSLTHGSNDAQKTMGIIALLLFSSSWLGDTFYIPFWVVISCQLVISLGTLAGGWRIINTLSNSITELNAMRGCAAETGAALMILASTEWGIPVSTTQTVTGSITGVGLINGAKTSRGPILRQIICSWLLTIPAAGLIAATIMSAINLF